MLEVDRLRKVYQRRIFWYTMRVYAVTDVSFRVQGGEVFGLVGESGCGKSTTGRCIVGLEQPTGGRVQFNGCDIFKMGRKGWWDYRRRVQMVFQDPAESLNPRQTVLATLLEPLNLHTKLSMEDKKRRVLDIIERVGLKPQHLTRYPCQLSGGEQQRVSIGRAVLCEPDLIVLDEPTACLDVSVRGKILQLLLELKECLGITYVLISHDLRVVRFMARKTAVMYLGKVVELGPSEFLFEEPCHPYTQALVSAIPVIAVERERKRKMSLHGEVPSAVNLPSGCFFHPRCSMAMPICESVNPSLHFMKNDHAVACHLF